MPRLLVQRKKAGRTVPPHGKPKFTVPSSPFQKLVAGAMNKLRMSGRQLAAILTEAGAPTSQSTLWTWLHHPKGFPAPRSFKAAHAQALATALAIDLADLHAAHDASMHRYTLKEEPTPVATHNALAVLEETVAAMKSRDVKRATILHLIQAVRRGCQ